MKFCTEISICSHHSSGKTGFNRNHDRLNKKEPVPDVINDQVANFSSPKTV